MNIFTEANDLESLYKRKKQIREELDSVYWQGQNLQANFVELSHMFPQRSQPYHITEQQDKLRGQINELNVAFSEYKKKKELIEGEITGRESCLGSSVTVYLEAVADGEATLSLTYLVNNVSFKPLYDIQIPPEVRVGSSEMNTMNAVYRASLQQSTGEDWKNVILKASTFNPTENVVIPDDSQNWAPQKPYKDVIPCSECTSYSPLREVITLSGPYTISHKTKTQEFQNIVIADLNFTEVKLDWVLVPALSRSVLLKATIRNTSDYFLLSGSAKIMLDDMLVGNTTIPVSYYYPVINSQVTYTKLGIKNRSPVRENFLFAHLVRNKNSV